MAIKLSILNMKGGVGKTTTSCAFASLMEMCGKRVLIIDLDAQANTTKEFQVYDPTDKSENIKDVFLSDIPVLEIIRSSPVSNVSVIPSNRSHSKTSMHLYQKKALEPEYEINTILRNRLKEVENNYDIIIMDNSPMSDVISLNSLVASDYVLTPVEVDGFSYEGLQSVLDDISNVKEEYNSDLEFLGVLMERCEVRTTLFTQLYKQFLDEFGDDAIKQPIRKDNVIKEALSVYMPLYRYQKRSKAGTDYINAAHEINLINDDEYARLIERHGLKKDNFNISKLGEGTSED